VCENCGRTIGRLETPHVWHQRVVCAPCYARLVNAEPAPLDYRSASSGEPPPARVASRTAAIQRVELTDKKWKKMQLAGGFGMFFSFLVMAMAVTLQSPFVLGLSIVLLVLTTCYWLAGGFGAWWNHG
jgi:hypothetical protein